MGSNPNDLDAAFDVVVIGGGSGSQVATAAADAGREAAVIERGPLGGACVTRGCVPSKALVHRADLRETIREAATRGIDATVGSLDFGAITDAIHDAVYAKADGQRERLREADRVTLYEGEGRFVDDRTVAVSGTGDGDDGGETLLRGDDVVIAVGGRPATPPIDGLDDVDSLTSDDALFLDERPDSLAVVGGGYVAAELGYVFGALGADVSIVGRSDRLVPDEDDDASAAVTRSLERYVDLLLDHEATAVSRTDGRVSIAAESPDGESVEVTADELLVAAGRRPNTDTLDLENTAVETDDAGHVETDETLATDADGVWALGDAVGAYPFKHVADYEARVVMRNVFGDGDDEGGEPAGNGGDHPATVDYEGIPHAVFTRPQVASVGETEGDLAAADREFASTVVPYDAAPMGLLRGADEAFVKVLAAPDGEILGCHVVGPEASTLIHEVALAMQRGAGTVDDVAETVHVHPALSEVLLAAFDDLSSSPYSTAPDWRDVANDASR